MNYIKRLREKRKLLLVMGKIIRVGPKRTEITCKSKDKLMERKNNTEQEQMYMEK